jgi:hypothetical protein
MTVEDISKRIEWNPKTSWQSTDAWRGYNKPYYAVAGSSDTGMWEDSPAPSNIVNEELMDLKSHLKKHGINAKLMHTESSNVFMVKRWLIVDGPKFEEAKRLVKEYLATHETSHIHE